MSKVDFMGVQPRKAKTRRMEKVIWKPPDWPWVKLDTDGAFEGTTNMAGGGGLVRDHLGRSLEAFCTPLAAVSRLEAEVKALREGILMAKTHGNYIWIEVDAEILCSLLDKGQLRPAYLRHDMVKIRVALRDVLWGISHIRREGNKEADFLAALGKDRPLMTRFMGTAIPSRVRALARLDQMGMPNFSFG